MRRAQGYATITDPDSGLTERDTFSCGHCQRIKTVKPKQDPTDLGGFCTMCDNLICEFCVGKGCNPWEKQMEGIEARDRLFRDMGLES